MQNWHTCLSIWFSFCKVESFSLSSEFFFSKSLTLVSKSLKYAFFLSLACWAETLFLSSLLPFLHATNVTNKLQKMLWINHRKKELEFMDYAIKVNIQTSLAVCFLCRLGFYLSSFDPLQPPEHVQDQQLNQCLYERLMFRQIHLPYLALFWSPRHSQDLDYSKVPKSSNPSKLSRPIKITILFIHVTLVLIKYYHWHGHLTGHW